MALSLAEQYRDPRWDKKSTEIKERDGWKCRICNSSDHYLEAHHLYYLPGMLLWEYDNEGIVTVCKKHHEMLTYDLPKLSGLIAFRILTSDIDQINIDWFIELLQNFKNG